MADEGISVRDPLGHDIFLLENVCSPHLINENPDIYDDFVKVIQKPALLIEIAENKRYELHYFRSIGWNQTVLIQVQKQHNRWESFSCIANPSNEALSELLRQGKQLL